MKFFLKTLTCDCAVKAAEGFSAAAFFLTGEVEATPFLTSLFCLVVK